MVLSDRLETILSMVKPGRKTADIGTDHGFLPIELVRRGIIPSAVAADVGEGPLSRAREHVQAAGLSERISLRISDGFDAFAPGELQEAVIAGMGGGLMSRLLLRGEEEGRCPEVLVLSPHSDAFRVRRFLRENRYGITQEKMVQEDGKYYPVIRAEKALSLKAQKAEAETSDPLFPEAEDLFGPCLIAEKDPVLLSYLERLKEQQKRILAGISEETSESAASRKKELDHSLQLIDLALEKMGR